MTRRWWQAVAWFVAALAAVALGFALVTDAVRRGAKRVPQMAVRPQTVSHTR